MKRKWSILILAACMAFFASPFLCGGCDDDDDDEKAALAFFAHVQATEDAHEPDNTPEEADAKGYFPYDTWFTGTAWGDDLYAIDVDSGMLNITITCNFLAVEGDIDLDLYDYNGNLVAFSDTITDNEIIDTVLSSAGVYYIDVYPFFSASGQQYDLIWTYTP